MEQEIVVSGTVREVDGNRPSWTPRPPRAASRIIRNGGATIASL